MHGIHKSPIISSVKCQFLHKCPTFTKMAFAHQIPAQSMNQIHQGTHQDMGDANLHLHVENYIVATDTRVSGTTDIFAK